MSVWYITILSVSDTGQITNYKIQHIFKDYNEMFDWFAYDKSSKNLWTYGTYRYDVLVDNQNLTGLDTKTDAHINSYGLYYTQSLRNIMLYDVDKDSIIDIRKYQNEILSHVHTAKRLTVHEQKRRKSRKQGRTHKKHYGYRNSTAKHGGLRKSMKINRALRQNDVGSIYNIPIKLYRGNAGDVYWDCYRKNIENNWKEKKVRKQWQYHQDISCKSHYKNLSKYCDDSWIIEQENDTW